MKNRYWYRSEEPSQHQTCGEQRRLARGWMCRTGNKDQDEESKGGYDQRQVEDPGHQPVFQWRCLERDLLSGRLPVAGKRGNAIGIQPDGRPLRAGGPDPYCLRDALRRHFENLELIVSHWLRGLPQRTFREAGTDFTGCHQLPRKIDQIHRQWFHCASSGSSAGTNAGATWSVSTAVASPGLPLISSLSERTAPALGRGLPATNQQYGWQLARALPSLPASGLGG